MNIRLQHLSRRFGTFLALNDVSLDIPSGHLVALLGPSGCGKTTLLRIVAGLERQDAGAVHFGQQDMSAVPARERNAGFVFQQ